MEKPVICPHCNKFFVADLESGNPFCLCPQCGRWMNVGALLKKGQRPTPSGPVRCPYCQAEMSPGNDVCPKCQREVATGKMLPLMQRLKLLPIGTKLLALCAALAVMVVIVVAVNLTVSYVTKPEPPPVPVPTDESPEVKTAQEILARLLKADDPAKAYAIGEELGRVGAPATDVILRALDRKDLTLAVQRGLIHALGGACRNVPNVAASDRLDALLNHPELGRTALISLAWMGDARAARRLEQIFAETFLHKEMGDALVRMNQLDDDIDPVGLQRVWGDRVRALRGPMAALGHHGLVRMLARYWPAWDWPTRDRGRAWMDEVNQVAGQILIGKHRIPEVRSVNDELVQLLSGAKPGVRLAAALLLHKRSAGGRSDRESWARALNDLLSHQDRTIRERTVWTLATITGKTFGRYGPDQSPTRVSPLALREAAAWLGELFGKPVRISPALPAEHETHKTAERRTYHPARAEARQLMADLPNADWPAARKAWDGLYRLPPDAAPVVRKLLDGDVRKLTVPARLVILQSLAWWHDETSAAKMDRLANLLDNPVWMPACLAVARTSASREADPRRWLDKVASLSPDVLSGRDPNRGFVPGDLAVLIAPQGRRALTVLQEDRRFQNQASPLFLVATKTHDAMTEFGWPTSAWR